jgi:deoxyribose-phosphate aldolase
VCVHGLHVARAARRIGGGDGPRVCSVVGFPHGANTIAVKRFEAERALGDGASEIDAVIALGAVIEGDPARVAEELAALVEVVHERGALLKVILETGALDDRQLELAARACIAARVDFLKTSTGFGPRGATVEDVRKLRAFAAGATRVKASGGIRTREDAERLVAAGADRLGTSASVAIVRGTS